MMKIAGAILAGGKASRYGGTPKGLIDIGGALTIVDHVIAEMKKAGLSDIVISANDLEAYQRFGLDIVPDERPNAGPLGGIEAVLKFVAPTHDAVLFCPCDLPGISHNELAVLLAAGSNAENGVFVAETGDLFWHPLCSLVHNAVLDRISGAIDRGELSVRRLWKKLDAAAVHFENEAAFFNVNTPEDLDRWRELKGVSRGREDCCSREHP